MTDNHKKRRNYLIATIILGKGERTLPISMGR